MTVNKDHITNLLRTEEYFKDFTNEKLLYDILFDNPTIFDVGAGRGTSLTYFSKIWDEFNIHCFEPQVNASVILRKEAEKLRSKKIKIKTNLTAVGDINSESKKFYCHHELSDGISGFIRLKSDSQDSINIQECEENGVIDEYLKGVNSETFVSVVRLDNYIELNSIGSIDLLKIDTQGYECEVLKGTGSYLDLVKNIILEVNLYDLYERSLSFYEVESLLRPFNFLLHDIMHISKNPMNGRTDWVEVLYTKK